MCFHSLKGNLNNKVTETYFHFIVGINIFESFLKIDSFKILS